MPLIQQVTVGAPLPNSPIGSTTGNWAGGRQDDGFVSEVHGVYYTANRGGAQYTASTAAAGVVIPISSTTTALTFVLFNPLGSPTVTELLRLNVGVTALGFIVGSLGLGFKSGLSAATQPLATTAATIIASNIGGVTAPNTQFFTAGTLSAAMSQFLWLPTQFQATTAGVNPTYDLNGSIILQPGSFATLVGTAAQTGAMVVSAAFNEWPV